MPVCYFIPDYEKKYNCEYEIKGNDLEITIDYEIMDEVESIDGVKKLGHGTHFDERDILIVDYYSKRNLMLKDAYYAGNTEVYGTPDDSSKTKFRSKLFFEHSDLDKILHLLPTPKVSKIKVFSKSISDWIGTPSIKQVKTSDSITYELSKVYEGETISLNHNNVKSITLSDAWRALHSLKRNSITIDFWGYIELELSRRVDYNNVYEYIYELVIFMQLYCPDTFSIDKIHVLVDKEYYILNIPRQEIDIKDKTVLRTVNEDLLNYLSRCYTSIPYRKSKTEIRNIPYIVLKTARNVEDNFLMFYRFIECFYKKKSIEGRNKFISLGLIDHYAKEHNLANEQIEQYAQEIICLRNHYVHSGYYIKNKSIKVSFEKIGRKKNPKDYTATNVDLHWIYDRTKMLYQIVVDIIFKEMLGFEKHEFIRHF